LVSFLRNPVSSATTTPAGAQLVEHIAAQVIAHLVDVPPVEVQQPLHTIRAQLTGLLSDRPGVLPLRTREQPEQIQPRPGRRDSTCTDRPATQGERFIEPGLPPSQAIIDYVQDAATASSSRSNTP
jgi:hypothetical protein